MWATEAVRHDIYQLPCLSRALTSTSCFYTLIITAQRCENELSDWLLLRLLRAQAAQVISNTAALVIGTICAPHLIQENGKRDYILRKHIWSRHGDGRGAVTTAPNGDAEIGQYRAGGVDGKVSLRRRPQDSGQRHRLHQEDVGAVRQTSVRPVRCTF